MDNTGVQSSKVGKLLPKGLTAKRRWKKQPSRESFSSIASNEDGTRGRSPHARAQSYDDDLGRNWSPAQSERTAEDEDLTTITYDSDHEHSPSRPTDRPVIRHQLSTHPSQIGHLTTSSPIIQSEHTPELRIDSREIEPISRSNTYSVSVSAHNSSNESPRLHPTSSKASLQPPKQSPSRSKSPAGRLKDVFKRRNSSTTSLSLHSEHSGKSDKVVGPEPIPRTSTTSLAPKSDSTPAFPVDLHAADVVSSDRSSRLKPQTRIDTSSRPQTPPSSAGAPVIVSTPPTPTGHAHPKLESPKGEKRQAFTPNLPLRTNVTVSPSGNMISHRRARSGSAAAVLTPSKLSNTTLAPLTPTPENSGPTTPGGGFFSSMLSVAQNAANTFSTISSTVNNKPKALNSGEVQGGDDQTAELESPPAENSMGEPAVKTLGMGDLSLSQLGIQDGGSANPTPVTAKHSESMAESRSRSESAPAEPPSAAALGVLPDEHNLARTRTVYETSSGFGERTPPGSVFEGQSGITRSGSIRGALDKRRKRGSTGGTTGTNGSSGTIGAAIAAVNASVAHPAATGSAPKLTGFAVASKKRNRDFHALFKSVPDDDYLIEDYSCALQREILAHGRLYVSEGHICFSSNIFGWVTTLVMSFDEIVSVEKRSTALVFKNGLMISTLHAKHIFASFTSRDSTYDLIINIWKLRHPTLRSSLNGVTLEGTGGDKTEKVDDLETPDDHSGSGSDVGDDDDDSEDSEEVYDEDEEIVGAAEATQPTEITQTDTDGEQSAGRKVSGALDANGGVSAKPSLSPLAPTGGADFPGPATHAATDCGDATSHYDVMIGDDIIPAPLGKVYNLVFGPGSVNFMGKWLTTEQKCTELNMENKTGLTLENKSRSYTYIRPLNSSVGPKQTRCILNETLDSLDLEKSVNISSSSQNPDVPSGNIFTVKTKYCLSWAENNSTRFQGNCTIEWSGKSWLKGPIEKGCKDGQIQYCKDLFAHLKAAVSARTRPTALPLSGPAKGKKKKGKSKALQSSSDTIPQVVTPVAKKTEDWGLFEPIHSILSPIIDIIGPILTGNVVYGLLVGLLVSTWFGFGWSPRQAAPGYGHSVGFLTHRDRVIAYEEIWRREESDLWDWLEERVGMHRMSEAVQPVQKHYLEPQSIEAKLREGKMNEREIEEAIRVTEEKLRVLKDVHNRKKAATSKSETMR